MINLDGRLYDCATKAEAEAMRDFKPDPEVEKALVLENIQVEANASARSYLTETDWYLIRYAETGEAVPPEVTAKRTAARLSVEATP